jgi:hypothetical protein
MGFENSGRRKQPAALKMLRGNPSKTPPNLNEPQPPAGEVVMPPGMSMLARVVWERLAPVCIQMGTLTPADTETFKRLCELQADLDEACRSKDAPEFAMFTLSEDYNGAPKMGLHAAIKLEKEFSPIIRPYFELFGLSAASRARISLPKKDAEPKSKWAGIK